MNDMYHITGDRQKRQYGYISNLRYYLREVREWDKYLYTCHMLYAFPTVAAAYLGTLLPAALVAGLEKQGAMTEVLLPLAGIVLVMMLCNMARYAIENYAEVQSEYFSLHIMKKYVSKVIHIDYERLEDKNFKAILENVWSTARFGRGLWAVNSLIPGLMYTVAAVCLYGFVLAQKNVILLLLAMFSIGLNLYLLAVARKMHQKYFGRISKYAKGEEYITAQCMDSAAGKDIRIYRMLDFIIKKYDENLDNIGKLYGKIHNWYCFRNLSGAVLAFARDAFAFALLAYQLVTGQITAADFVFYIGIIAGFSQQFEMLIRYAMNMNTVNTTISYIREFMGTESVWRKYSVLSQKELDEFKKKPIKLELRDVTFTYQGNTEPTIKDLNLVIQPGEKLALIGLNGAGKTTLVKLICGFYMPEKGKILLNDIPMENYTKEQYFSLISVLFQDTTLLPMSLDDNIMSGMKKDTQRLEQVLKLSGFWEKYQSLEQKGETRLVKKVEESAVDFSGGEKQKLLFARALYKEAPLVILDEPTAALDPIAENELYMNFGDAMDKRTAIYISHRLSSTRFCDRIILLEHGRIIEEGNHDTLMAANGRYAALYEMQSQYYKDEEKQKQRSALMGDEYVEIEKGGVFHE